MAQKKLVTVQFLDEVSRNWISQISATACIPTYAKGFISGIQQSYPCPTMRLIDYRTQEILDVIKGNGKVKVNNNE